MTQMVNDESHQVQSNLGLVVKLARSFKPRTKEDLDDLIQVGTIGLIKAIRKHDPKIAKLTTIAWLHIKWEILRYLNSQDFMMTNQELPVSQYLDKEVVTELLPDNLSKLEQRVVLLKVEGYNFEDIGKQLGYTRGWTNKLFKSALRKIKNANQK